MTFSEIFLALLIHYIHGKFAPKAPQSQPVNMKGWFLPVNLESKLKNRFFSKKRHFHPLMPFLRYMLIWAVKMTFSEIFLALLIRDIHGKLAPKAPQSHPVNIKG